MPRQFREAPGQFRKSFGKHTGAKGFEIIDPHTLRIHLIKPYPQFRHILAMAYTAPLPREVFNKYGQFALNERIVGTGPFRFRE